MNEPKPCSAETAFLLYRQLEYYREFMPSIVGMSKGDYTATQEAKNTDKALSAYRSETGTPPTAYPV